MAWISQCLCASGFQESLAFIAHGDSLTSLFFAQNIGFLPEDV